MTSRLPRMTHWTGLIFGLALIAGCAHTGSVPTRTHAITILDTVSPQRLYVQVGEEVRWKNLRNHPVHISLLTPLASDGVSCATGFSHWGVLNDTATIQPNAYASLCFVKAGSVQYNVWLNPDDPLRSMTPTANIIISANPS
ncbi:MAG: hypothetical protein U0412_13840 [Nitrospira sp.]